MIKFFDYFQIMSLFFFLFVFVGRTLYLRFSQNINPITLGAGKKGLQRIVEFSFFVGLLIWMAEVLLYSLHTEFYIFPLPLRTQLIDSLLAKLIGLILVIIGFIIFIRSLISFGNAWRVGIDEKTPGGLITTGIFAFSRNPIFIFIDFYFIGTFLINGTLLFLFFAILVVLGLHYQILQEEKSLLRTYGQKYQNYCAETGRYSTWRHT